MQVGFESMGLAAMPKRAEHCACDAGSDHAVPSKPIGALCITLYNERYQAFQSTLIAVLQALGNTPTHRGNRTRWEICIVADGRDRVDPQIIAGLCDRQLLCSEHAQRRGGVESHRSVHRLDELLGLFTASSACPGDTAQEVALTVLLKDRNRGKLHSHYLFFNRFCRAVQPRYCFQIDVGTILHPKCVSQLVEQMERDPSLAALAPKVMPAVPGSDSHFLAEWQYLDFAYRKAISWPFEVSTQFLSVIPGQAGIFRWSALDPVGTSAADSPLRAYFRGLQAQEPLECLMYLAEDRVIGASMVLAKDCDWRLGYSPDAQAVTDSCESFAELLRQRRRWTNSSLACRYWLLKQVRAFVARKDKTLCDKGGFVTAALAQFVLALREFLAPAQLIALSLVFVATLTTATHSTVANLLQCAFASSLALQLGLALYCFSSRDSRAADRTRSALEWCTAILYGGVLICKLPAVALAILFAPALAVLPAMLVLPASAWPIVLRTYLFPISALATFSVLLFYAIAHLNDVSWGTKGLTSATQTHEARRRMRRLRNATIAGLILANVLAVAAATRQGWFSTSLNPITELSCVLEFVMALIALGYLAQTLLRRTAARRGSSAGVQAVRFSSSPIRIQSSRVEQLVSSSHEQRGVSNHTH